MQIRNKKGVIDTDFYLKISCADIKNCLEGNELLSKFLDDEEDEK